MQLKRNAVSAMPGKRYLLDTNALIALLQGNRELMTLTRSADWLGVSVINVLEFLGFDGLTEQDRQLFQQFVSRITVVDLVHSNAALMAHITAIRQTRTFKLPDAIVMASAALHEATLITNDAQLLTMGTSDASLAALGFATD
jgi:tRNA(fMet)-specific endonuclease VapC